MDNDFQIGMFDFIPKICIFEQNIGDTTRNNC